MNDPLQTASTQQHRAAGAVAASPSASSARRGASTDVAAPIARKQTPNSLSGLILEKQPGVSEEAAQMHDTLHNCVHVAKVAVIPNFRHITA